MVAMACGIYATYQGFCSLSLSSMYMTLYLKEKGSKTSEELVKEKESLIPKQIV